MRLALPILAAGAFLALGGLPAAAQQPGTSFCDGQLTLLRIYAAPSIFAKAIGGFSDIHVVLRNQGPRSLVLIWDERGFRGGQEVAQGEVLDKVVVTLPAGMPPPHLRFTCQQH